MNRAIALKIARNLMSIHGLKDWKLKTEDTLEFMGACTSSKRSLYLSEDFLNHCLGSQLTEIMLHEIAHALVGDHEGHNKVWKEKCIEIGATPSAYQTHIIPLRYQALCPVCGQFFSMRGKPRVDHQCDCKAHPILTYVDVTKLEDPRKKGYKPL